MRSQRLSNRHGMSNQTGFTLIELMIVVAVIGILASVAVPQYRTYVDRAKVSETLASLSIVKLGVTEYILSHASFPATLEDAGVPTSWQSTYVQQTAVLDVPYAGLAIVMRGTDNVEIDGKGIYLFSNFLDGGGVTKPLTWYCSIPTGAGFDPITAKYVPSVCRQDFRG